MFTYGLQEIMNRYIYMCMWGPGDFENQTIFKNRLVPRLTNTTLNAVVKRATSFTSMHPSAPGTRTLILN